MDLPFLADNVGTTDDPAVPYLYLAILVVIGLFVLTVVFSGRDLGYLFDFKRHEWYRELRRDYFTSRLQFWREWRGLKQFARTNSPWLYGVGIGGLGLCLVTGLLLVDLPKPVRAGILTGDEDPNNHRFATHVSPINSKAATEPVIASATRTLLVQLPIDLPQELVASEPSAPEPAVETTDPFDLNSLPPEQTEPKLEETPLVTHQSTRPQPTEDEVQAAFEEFNPAPAMEATQPPAPDLDAVVIRGTLPDYSDMFVVESKLEFDVGAAVARLESDDWVRGDPVALNEPERSELYVERYGLPRSLTTNIDEPIRIRPVTAPGQAAPGVSVQKMISRQAVAGAELSYEIVVSNPTNERVSDVILEESIPATWDFVDAEPRGVMIRRDTLQWRLEPLAPDARTSILIRVRAGEEAEATTRTIVTTAAAVGAIVDVVGESREVIEPIPDLNFMLPEPQEPPPAAPSLPDPEDWRPAERSIPTPEVTEVERVPGPQLKLTTKVASRVSTGHFKVFVTVRNTGGTAVDDARVVIWLSNLVKHPGGSKIEQAVKRLNPNESRVLPVHLKAITPGDVINRIELRSTSTVYDSAETKFTITQPPTSPEDWRRR